MCSSGDEEVALWSIVLKCLRFHVDTGFRSSLFEAEHFLGIVVGVDKVL